MWLVVSIPLNNISQLGCLFPVYGQIKMFQTTNQVLKFVFLLWEDVGLLVCLCTLSHMSHHSGHIMRLGRCDICQLLLDDLLFVRRFCDVVNLILAGSGLWS